MTLVMLGLSFMAQPFISLGGQASVFTVLFRVRLRRVVFESGLVRGRRGTMGKYLGGSRDTSTSRRSERIVLFPNRLLS